MNFHPENDSGKRKIRRFAVALAAGAAALVGASAAGRADSSFLNFQAADKSLSLAISEAQAGVGGTVIEVNRNRPGAAQRYSAVVLDPNGVLQHVSFDLPVDYMWPARPVTAAEYTHTGDLAFIRISMIDAVHAAESTAGRRASAADFVASPDGRVVAYQVVFYAPRGQQSRQQPRKMIIDARTGTPLTNIKDLGLTS